MEAISKETQLKFEARLQTQLNLRIRVEFDCFDLLSESFRQIKAKERHSEGVKGQTWERHSVDNLEMLARETLFLQIVIEAHRSFYCCTVDRIGKVADYRRVEEEPNDGNGRDSLVISLLRSET